MRVGEYYYIFVWNLRIFALATEKVSSFHVLLHINVGLEKLPIIVYEYLVVLNGTTNTFLGISKIFLEKRTEQFRKMIWNSKTFLL